MSVKLKKTFLPRSTLSTLHEPLIDPKDGHGARSKHDVMVMKLWEAAKTSGKEADAALAALINLIMRDDLVKLRAARGRTARVSSGGGPYRLRSLIPAMTYLGMITAETIAVPPEYDGHAKVTTRQKIAFRPWLERYAFERRDAQPAAVEEVRSWLDGGGLQRPFRSWWS